MRKISLTLASTDQFLDNYQRDLPGGGVFVPTLEEYYPGEVIQLELFFPQIPEGLVLEGTIAWRRAPARWKSALRPGIGVSFGQKQRSRLEFLLDLCRGDLDRIRKPGRRVPANMRVDIVRGDQRSVGRSKDISRGGVFVLTDLPLDRLEQVELDLFFPGSTSPERFLGTVAWSRHEGEEMGVGVRFAFRTPVRRRQIGNLVSSIEGRLASGSGVTPLGPVRA